MKTFLTALAIALAGATLAMTPDFADAKRLGAGKPAGMQRAAPPPATPTAPAKAPTQAAAPTTPPTPAAAPKRSWMGPLAGLAAGIGLAALFSHFGMGEGMSNIIMMVLLALVAVVVVRWLIRRFAGGGQAPQLATAGAGAGTGAGSGGWAPQVQAPQPDYRPIERQGLTQNGSASTYGGVPPLAEPSVAQPQTAQTAQTAASHHIPGGMATEDFERLAKLVFSRMQAANDAANLDDLRKFTTPELFASLRLDLQERGPAAQQTDVVQVDAKVAEVAEVVENGVMQSIVTVRFSGLIREQAGAAVEPFNELWHLVRPASGTADWAIAGITPVQ